MLGEKIIYLDMASFRPWKICLSQPETKRRTAWFLHLSPSFTRALVSGTHSSPRPSL